MLHIIMSSLFALVQEFNAVAAAATAAVVVVVVVHFIGVGNISNSNKTDKLMTLELTKKEIKLKSLFKTYKSD